MANRTTIDALIASEFPDNTSGQITPEVLRTFLETFNDSAANVDDENTFTEDNTFEGVTTFEKVIKTKQGADLTAASTINPGNSGNYHLVTGSTTISAIQDGQAGTILIFEFQDTPLLTHNASFLLPGQTDLKAESGDVATFLGMGSGDWKCINYTRKDGRSVRVDFYVFGSPPGANDDSSRGFTEGSIWVDSGSNYSQYRCVDATFEAAVWEIADPVIDVGVANLQTLIANSALITGQKYRIVDSAAGYPVWVWAFAVNGISGNAALEGTSGNAKWGRYILDEDFFWPSDNRAASAPTVDDDIDRGFVVNDIWIDSTTQIKYVCTDNTDGAAVWQAQSGEYTPAITDNGADATATLLKAYFNRVGNLVYCNVQIDVAIAYSTGSGNIYITTPVLSSATLDNDNTFGNYDFKNYVGANIPTDMNYCDIAGNGTNSVVLEMGFGANIATPGRTYLSFVYPLS